MSFEDLLKQCNMDKTGLSAELGIHRRSIYRWRDDPPVFVLAYLKLKVENKLLRERLAGLDQLAKLAIENLSLKL